MYYLEDIKEDTTVLPPPAALPLPPPEQSLTTQEPSQGTEIPIRAQKEKNGEVEASQTEEKTKEKAKNKVDANPSEDALTVGDMVSKAKTTESKSKIDSKKDSHQSQTKIRGFSFVFVIFVMASCFFMQHLYLSSNEGIYFFI